MHTPEQSPLGKPSAYADQLDARLLFPIARAPKRAEIGIEGAPRFFGADLWTAYELSWLTPRGKPQVAIAHFTIPCETPSIVESKSFKLYLKLLRGIDALYATPTPYIAAWHQAPVNSHRDEIRLMLQITSPRRAETKLKFLAGSEAAMGAWIGDVAPETSAALIREAIERV